MSVETSNCTVTIKRYDAESQVLLSINAVAVAGDLQSDKSGKPAENPFVPKGQDESDGAYYTQWKLYLDPYDLQGFKPRIGDYYYIVEDEGVLSGTYRQNVSAAPNTGGGQSYLKIPLICVDEGL